MTSTQTTRKPNYCVSTDKFGNRSFTFTPATAVSVGKTVTATATSTSGSKDTSEFSAPRKVASS